MRTRFAHRWDTLRSSYWFVPGAMTLAAIVLSFATLAIDDAVGGSPGGSIFLAYAGGADGARALLTVVASSMITVASVAFSVTLVVLSLASSQFGARLLRNFMRDTANQIVLGTFISTFSYCLLVLRAVQGPGADAFIPHISVTISIAFAMASVGVLIFFIHHVSASIQVENVVAGVVGELNQAIVRLLPADLPEPEVNGDAASESVPDQFQEQAQPVPADRTGYIQAVDTEGLLAIAADNDLIFRLERRSGQFVAEEGTLCLAFPQDRINDDLVDEINRKFIVGKHRSPRQDVEFAIDQLVEIAVRALSPGINDPFTAMSCIDQLGAALSELAGRPTPSPLRFDREGRLRLVVLRLDFDGFVDAAFNQVRQHAHSSVAVTIRLLEALAVIAAQAQDDEQRKVLLRHAEMVMRGSREGLTQEQDQEDVLERYNTVLSLLGQQM